MKKAIRPGFGTDGLLLWRKVKLLRCGDGKLCIAGEKDVICLVKINRLLKALIQNVYPASVLHYDTGYGTVEAEEVRIGLFACVCCQGNALAAKLHGGDRERFQTIGSVLPPAGAGFQGDGFGQQLNLPIKILPRKRHILGKNIFGTDFCFDLDIKLGAGAFVCGEETALMTSIEGKRGEPRPRPPFPAVKGLFAKPTILNNVETYANVPQIILKGADWFASMGTEKSKGTKVFALGGKIKNTGLVEIPMGTTLRTIVEEIGGGIPGGKKFKAAQTGGPSGGCIPASLIDTPIDYDNLIAIGSMMGSGGLIVMDEDTCMVDIAKFFLEFTVDESCGKCTPCRVGTKRLLELLTKITDGKGTMEDLDKITELAEFIKANSLCGLGQTAPNPVLSTLRYFRDEYEEHIKNKRCPAGVCKALLNYKIDPVKCKGCTLCARACPAGAITGTVRQPHAIDTAKCVKCGACMEKCKFGAISKG